MQLFPFGHISDLPTGKWLGNPPSSVMGNRTWAERMFVVNSIGVRIVVTASALVLTACAQAPVPEAVFDPNEASNRKMFAFNQKLDRALLAPASSAYGEGLPPGVRRGVSNFSDNVDLPGTVVNKILQGEFEDAMHNTVRFAFNSTFGLLGLFDVATGIGLEERDTDFGETLHRWGIAEGRYVVLPVFGPSTDRDAAGIAVDFVLNPLSYVVPSPENNVLPVANVVSRLGDRYEFGGTIDAVLHEGEDPYASARLFYLDARRYDLGVEVPDEDLYDLYEEAYE